MRALFPIVIAALLTACAGTQEPAPEPTASVARQADADLAYIDHMIHHHRMGIEMAQLVDARAEHDELRTFADRMIADQQQDIRRLEAMRDAWYPDEPRVEQGAMGRMHQELAQKSGRDFDLAFLDAMTRHHETAIQMSRDFEPKARHPELERFAEDVVTKQQREVDQMRAWRDRWTLRG